MRYLLCFFLLFASTLVAQSELEELVLKLEMETSSKGKIDLYNKIGKLTHRKNNEVYIKYTKKLIDLAIEIKEYDIAAMHSIDLFAIYRNHMGDPEKALKVFEKIQKYEDQLKDSQNIGGIYQKIGGYYYSGNNFDKAIENYTKAIAKYTSNDSIYIADATFFRGQVYSFKGDFVKAANDYEIAIIYYTNLDDQQYVINTKNSLALLYSNNGFQKEADKIQDEVLTYSIATKDYNTIATTYYNKALQAKKRNDNTKELDYLQNAAKYFKKADVYTYQLVIVQCGLADFYARQGNLHKAKEFLNKVEIQSDILKTNKRIQSFYNVAKIQIEKSQGNYDKALDILKTQEHLSKDWNNTTQQINDEKQFYELYKLKGDKEKALYHIEKYNTLSDSIYNTQKINTLLYYQNLYESERKDRDIALLEKDSIIKRNWLLFGGIGLTLLFTSLYLLKGKFYADKSKKMQEQYSQNLILEQEKERKRIASELHDSVGQQLLLIKNQSIIGNMANIKSIANQTIEEVRTISMNLHPYQLEEFGLTKAIKMNLKKFEQSADGFVTYEIDEVDEVFDETQEINIYRIIQECVSNIVKHSMAKASRIELKKNRDGIQVTVNDNGIGYNYDKAYNSRSLGLKTLKERLNFLNGTMTISSEKNKGTKIQFIIPFNNV
ncbi:ATP-binding protein [uncultured Lacinutrix sp.]|uniref:tetratricopeptide repeat-containing sensor histidine kinase n=1 Tax=uncultured Lacinutrix sp. TaxID=574032 RepID=UPI002610B318|nr:ATP-binding protein [uncultured Lacinutrix sp.]